MKPKYQCGDRFETEVDGNLFIYTIEYITEYPLGSSGRYQYVVKTYMKNKNNDKTDLYYTLTNEKNLEVLEPKGGEK